MKHAILYVLFFLTASTAVWGQHLGVTSPSERTASENFTIYYRFDRPEIDLTYKTNQETYKLLKGHLQNTARIDSVIVYVSSSPDGDEIYNGLLSRKRAAEVEKFIVRLVSDRQGISIKTVALDNGWNEFVRLIEEDYFRRDRKEVLEILHAENMSQDARKARLEELDGGKTWGYILWKHMPLLRNATFVSIKMKEVTPLPRLVPVSAKLKADPGRPIIKPLPEPPAETRPVEEQPHETRQQEIQQTEEQTAFEKANGGGYDISPLYALRTNLLVPALNVGGEVSLGSNWSVGADWYFPWFFRKEDNQNCFQLLGLNLEGRYWFGRNRTADDRLRGHSLGANVYGGYYDIGQHYAGNQGEFVSVGLDYLYAIPLFKEKVHLEFSLGVGYLYSFMKPYDVFEAGGKAYKTGYTKDFHWFGPTKATVSLVVPIRSRRAAR